MAGIALLLPTEGMVKIAEECVTKEGFEVKEIRHIVSSEAISAARESMERGATIVIARGYQAMMIKKHTNIPVVEITLTGQEIARMLKRAKTMVDVPCPVIGLIGLYNTFSNVDFFDELFDLQIKKYYVSDPEDIGKAAEKAVAEKVDIVIGGDIAIETAQKAGVASLFLESTADSIREAIRSAESAIYAVQLEKNYNARLEALLENTSNGFIRMNSIGIIMNVNHVMEDILKQKRSDMVGRLLTDVLPEINRVEMEKVLDGSQEIYSSFVQMKENPVTFVLTAVKVDDLVNGALLSCFIVKQNPDIEAYREKELYLNGYVAHTRFSDIVCKDHNMSECVELAKLYSLSTNSVLLSSSDGNESAKFAEAIHNNSIWKSGPFIKVNCSGLTDEQQEIFFLGQRAAEGKDLSVMGCVANAHHGTLYIEEIEKLTPYLQYVILNVIREKTLINYGANIYGFVDMRIIASSGADLAEEVRRGTFREDLFCMLRSLSLKIPSLKERQLELEELIVKSFSEKLHQYNRYHILTPAAKKVLMQFPWQSGRLQVECFIDRLVLSAKKRKVESDHVQKLLFELFPIMDETAEQGNRVIYKDYRSEELLNVLEKHNGNREETAKELGISKTTLWRHMKQYGIAYEKK